MLQPGQQLQITAVENGYILTVGSMFGNRALVARNLDALLFEVRNILTDGITPVPPDFTGEGLDLALKTRLIAETPVREGPESSRRLDLMAKWKAQLDGAR